VLQSDPLDRGERGCLDSEGMGNYRQLAGEAEPIVKALFPASSRVGLSCPDRSVVANENGLAVSAVTHLV
jgi:hypothetical protein